MFYAQSAGTVISGRSLNRRPLKPVEVLMLGVFLASLNRRPLKPVEAQVLGVFLASLNRRPLKPVEVLMLGVFLASLNRRPLKPVEAQVLGVFLASLYRCVKVVKERVTGFLIQAVVIGYRRTVMDGYSLS